jgi:SARP family transcriptional regulator, regulator of embCAB operon
VNSGPDGTADRPDFRVLGPLRVLRAGADLALGGEKPRAVLALMLLRRNRTVPVSTFAEDVWGRGAGDVQANLQVLISNLRRVLGPSGSDAQRYIQTSPAGYSMSVPDANVDLARFRSLGATGNAARAARRPADAARAYAAALREWSGERGLEDLAGVPFADAFGQTMEHEWLSVLQARIEADMACRRHDELLGELYTLARRYPLNDVFCGQLVTALMGSGRSVDAADVYHGFRERYQSEMGANVPESLRRVWTAVSREAGVPDHYGSQTVPSRADRTVVDDALAELRGELVHGRGTRTEVTGRLTIGRVGCDLVLPDARISKTHAVITPTPDGFVISDLQSTNGTFVNGIQVVVPQVLDHLDRIRLGGTELVFRRLSG